MTKRKGRATSDAIEILDRRYVTSGRKRAVLDQALMNAAIAQAIHDLRRRAGLTQAQLAARVGTSHSVISRLEDADYDGHSLKLLVRISAALDHRLEVRFTRRPKRRAIA